MENEVDVPVDGEVLRDIVIHERKRVSAQVLDILQRPGFEVVDADHPEAFRNQVIA
jgi:hypothetical protein